MRPYSQPTAPLSKTRLCSPICHTNTHWLAHFSHFSYLTSYTCCDRDRLDGIYNVCVRLHIGGGGRLVIGLLDANSISDASNTGNGGVRNSSVRGDGCIRSIDARISGCFRLI